jgi:hypothetical protein
MSLAWTFAIRLAVCFAFAYLAWRGVGPVGLAVSAGLFGLLLAKPLVELASALRHAIRARAWKPVEGRYWAYRGQPVQVLEDEDHRRWIRADDVRAIVGFTASNGALALTYPNGFRKLGRPARPHFSDEALLAHLAKENSTRALKFRHWVERDIAFAARRLRERKGEGERVAEQPAGFEPSKP